MPPYVLKELDGPRPGRKYPLEWDTISIGRGLPGVAGPDWLVLDDESLAPLHAVLTWRPDERKLLLEGRSLQHQVRVNGAPIRSAELKPGDRIKLGRVVLEVEEAASRGRPEAAMPPWVAAEMAYADTIMVTDDEYDLEENPAAFLEVVRGLGGLEGHRVALYRKDVTIGRSKECNIRIEDGRISRQHATIRWIDGLPMIEHVSSTNSTRVNRSTVRGHHLLRDGDLITLAGKIVLRWVQVGAVDIPSGER